MTVPVHSTGAASWLTELLWVAPAKVAGTWRLPTGELRFEQKFQMVSGSSRTEVRTVEIEKGRLRGNQISFRAGDACATGNVDSTTMTGVARTPRGAVDLSATLTR